MFVFDKYEGDTPYVTRVYKVLKQLERNNETKKSLVPPAPVDI